MGRALITANQGAGLYTVEVDYGTTEINQRISSLQSELGQLESAVTSLTGDIAQAESDRSSAQSALNAAIAALNSAGADDSTQRKAVDEATQSLYQALAVKGLLESKRSRANARIANIEQQIETLQGVTLTQSKSAWCCDYTEDGAGQVATAEINGEQPQLLVVPGAPAPDGSEGLMTDRLAMSPAATFLNAAILPGWQKFSPTYRVGEITSINASDDTCDVDLDPATSSAQGLDINQASSLQGVPIQYMTCDSAVFIPGDRVVVRFDSQDWSQPKVIGFESNPRPCTDWLWAGVNDRITTPVEQINRLTAKINPATLATDEVWSRTGEESVGMARRLFDAPVTRAVSGRLTDPRDGVIYWSPDHSHSSSIYGPTVQMSLHRQGGRMLNALYGSGFTSSPDDGDRLYDWPDGNFIKILDDPAVLIAGIKQNNGAQSAVSDSGRIFMVAGYQIPGEIRTAYAVYDKQGEPLFSGGLGGTNQFSPQGAAAGGGYFAATMESGSSQVVYIISEATGALVNTLTDTGFASRWRDIAIRKDKLFLISHTGSPGNIVYSVSRYTLPGLVFEDSAVIGWDPISNQRSDLGSID